MLAVATGVRRGELVNLHWSDVDAEGGWIHVRNRGSFRTKGGGERSVPMTPPGREVLERLRAERQERGEKGDGPVPTGEYGGALYPNLRHTTAAWLAQ